MKKTIFILVALLTLAAVPSQAQTYLTATTLSNAVTSTTADRIVVASATTAAVGGAVYIDHELMTIRAISGTTLTVVRGQQGTVATTHNSAAAVIIAPVAALQGPTPAFTQLAGRTLAGSCNPANYPYLPIVDTDSGNVFLCWASGASGPSASRLWHGTNTVGVNAAYSLMVNLQ